LLATLLILAVGLVALLALVTAAFLASFFLLLVRAPVAAIRRRSGYPPGTTPGA